MTLDILILSPLSVKSLSEKKKLRRGKRQVVFDDVIEDDDDATEKAIIRQQLAQLSDSELDALASIVRQEMDRYAGPEFVAVPQYEIIEIPDEYLEGTAVMEPFPRDRRSIPSDWAAAAAAEEEMNEPEYIVVPEEAVIEALEEEQDEQELRDRIAEIAQILNERATRRSRLL
ncbi:hypothetical protein Aduo_001502 [Ancylostoma duodenale]